MFLIHVSFWVLMNGNSNLPPGKCSEQLLPAPPCRPCLGLGFERLEFRVQDLGFGLVTMMGTQVA